MIPTIRAGRRVLCAALVALGCSDAAEAPRRVVLGATTSLEDSGLLGMLSDSFMAAHDSIALVAITGGTGEVLAMAKRGDVDVALTHDPVAESALVAAGDAVARHDVMHNHFVLVGPGSDPARVRGLRDAAAALARIAESRARFVSRADDSGTHRRERMLWRAAGLAPDAAADRAWYIEVGVGMGDALRLAAERDAYILTDRATYVVMPRAAPLRIMVEADPRLLNRYGVLRVTRARNPGGAARFVDWLLSPRAQRAIARFGVAQFGTSLFNLSAGGRAGAPAPGR